MLQMLSITLVFSTNVLASISGAIFCRGALRLLAPDDGIEDSNLLPIIHPHMECVIDRVVSTKKFSHVTPHVCVGWGCSCCRSCSCSFGVVSRAIGSSIRPNTQSSNSTLCTSTLKFDVSLVSPVGAPRVFDNPIVTKFGVISISYYNHCMIAGFPVIFGAFVIHS